jgi:hypothetical protein
MLDVGSPRVFNCNEMTQRILAADPDATPFYRNKPLNTTVLIKDASPEDDRRHGAPPVGTKLYFPFNDTNIYEGGRTIFLHDKHLESAIIGQYGEGAVTEDALDRDMHVLRILDKLPSLDPFLLKDIFLRNKIAVNENYFEVSQEAWHEIEAFMLQKFEPLVRAAFPDIDASGEDTDDKARQLIDKIWEARDIVALQPLIDAFRLPQDRALDIFSSWRGIVYYSYQYQREQTHMIDLIKWLAENDKPVAGVPANEAKEMQGMMSFTKDSLRQEWKKIEEIVREYQDSYDKMFKYKTSSSGFLNFLKRSNDIYWELGNSLGRTNHAIYCWNVMSSRHKERKLPWKNLQDMMRMLSKLFEPDKKSTTSVAWGN